MGRALTTKTNLDTLRKDAKRWLKAVRAGDADAVSRLAAALGRSPDAPALRDVQQALAREFDCESWIALKAALDDLMLARKTHEERVEQVLRHGWDGDASAARRILSRFPEIARDSLFAAAACGDLADVERRLARDPEGARRVGGTRAWTALAYAAYSRLDDTNAVAIVERLIAAGADPNFRFSDNWDCPFTVLTGAIGLGEGAKPSHPQVAELVEVLIAAGAEPYDLQALYNVSIVGEDVGWYEVLWRHCEAKGELDKWRVIAKGRLGEHLGKSTLDYLLGNAVGQNHVRRAQWLLERGADVNTTHAYTRQPLLAVARLAGAHAMAELLAGHGAEPVTLTGAEALQAALLAHDRKAARSLATADPDAVRSPAPLLAAAMFGDLQAVDLALSLGADVQGLGHDGISPLHRAVQSGSLPVVDRLLAAGADVALRERRWGGTPMSWSCVLGQPHLAERLAPLSKDMWALVRSAKADRLRTVLEAEPVLANRALGSDDEPTPLFCLPGDEVAALTIAQLLLDYGADPKARNAKGATPADVARIRGLEDAADLLEDAADAR